MKWKEHAVDVCVGPVVVTLLWFVRDHMSTLVYYLVLLAVAGLYAGVVRDRLVRLVVGRTPRTTKQR